MAGGQLALHRAGVPGSGTAAPPQVTPAAAPAAAPVSAGGIPLPVGIGIRLGGVGGVAPAMAQAAVRPIAGQYMMWGGQPPGVNMSEQAVSERRQRNREHAKRSRVRKKFMLESLQEQVRGLQKENVHLRMLIQQKIPHASQQILSECCTPSPLFSDPDIDLLGPIDDDDPKVGKRKKQPLVKADFSLMASLTTGQQNFVLSDPRLPDNPIVYASPGFYVTTGYTQDQVLGRNCRFLQGPGTDPRAVDIIRSAVASGSDASTCLLNYKADGTPFWNQFFVAALRDSDNCIVNYVSSMCCMFYFTCVCSRFTQVNAFVSSSRLESNAK
jgi:PAS domain-containing protein